MSKPTNASGVDRKLLNRAVRGSLVGTIMEWYDVGIFGYLIVVMGPVFLPESNQHVQTIFLLGTFAATFIARPVGGIFYGWLGDKIGRAKVLGATLLLVSASTFAIGLLPGFATIGIWAAVLLVLMKLLQGFSAGGEYAGVTTFVGEHAPADRRGYYASFMPLGSYLGFAAGAATVATLQTFLSPSEMESYGWRIPFLLAGPLALIAIWFRSRVEESEEFKNHLTDKSSGKVEVTVGVRSLFSKHGKIIIAAIIIVAAENISAYALTSYMPTYMTISLQYDSVQSTWLTVPILVLVALAMPLMGHLSDRIGLIRLMRTAAVSAVVLAVPAFLMLGSGTIWGILVGLILIAIPAVLFGAAIPSAIPSQFPTAVRFLCMGITYNLAVAIFGGTTPMVSEALISATGNTLIPGFYIMLSGIAAYFALRMLKETSLAKSGPILSQDSKRYSEQS